MALDKSGHSEREFYIPPFSFFQFEKLKKLFTGLPKSVGKKKIEPLKFF